MFVFIGYVELVYMCVVLFYINLMYLFFCFFFNVIFRVWIVFQVDNFGKVIQIVFDSYI